MRTIKHLLFFLLTLFLLESCSRNKQVKVEYRTSDAVSEYTVSWLNESGTLKISVVDPESKEDRWNYSMMAEEGTIVFISGKYKSITSSLRLHITVDGKTYKEGFSTDDTTKFLVVSGVAPYNND